MPKINPNLEAFSTYLVARKSSALTVKNYSVTIGKFLQFVGKSPSNINIQDVESFVHKMLTDGNGGKTYRSNSLCSKYYALKQYISYLNSRYHQDHPMIYDKELLTPPPHVIPYKEVLTKEEISKLFDVARVSRRDLALLQTLYYTTQRKSSVIGIDVDDINWDEGVVHIRFGLKQKKGTRDFYAPIKDALPAIRDYLDHREEPEPGERGLFLNGCGKRLSKESPNYILKKYATLAKIQKKVFIHLIRATSISIMSDAGLSRDSITQISGHLNERSLDTYIRPNSTLSRQKSSEALSLSKPSTTPQQKVDCSYEVLYGVV